MNAPGSQLRVLGLFALLGVAIAALAYSRDDGASRAAVETCRASDAEDWPAALALSEGIAPVGDAGRAAAQCRCFALLATGEGPQCEHLLEALMAGHTDGTWAPDADLSVHLIQTWRDAGRSENAARLARVAAARHPDHPGLFFLELSTRAAVATATE